MTVRARAQARFENAVQAAQDRIEGRLDTYAATLRGAAGLIAADRNVSPDEFHAFVEHIGLRRRYPGVQGVGFSKRIAPGERAAFERDVRARGLPDFRIWPERPSEEEVHAVVLLEPMDRRNQAAIGFNMFTEATRREAMARARDTGTPALSGKVTLVQEIDEKKQAGFLLYNPVYRGREVPTTVQARRAALEGFVYSPFRADDLFAGIFGTETNPRVAFRVYDGPKEGAEHLLHDSFAAKRPGPPADFTTTTRVEVAGRTWTLVYRSLPFFESAFPSFLVPAVGGIGTLMSFLLFALALAQAGARKRAEASAQSAHASAARLRVFFEANLMGLIFFDVEGGITDANDAFLDAVGYTREDLKEGRIDWRALTPPEWQAQDAALVKEMLETGKHRAAEKEYFRKDGSRLPLIVASTFFPDSRKEGVGFILDISERKAAEAERARMLAELDARQRLMDAVLEQLPTGLVVAEAPSGRMLVSNRQVEAITGRPSAWEGTEDYGDGGMGFRPDGTPLRPEEWPLARALTSGEVVTGEEVHYQRGDGSRAVLRLNAAPVRDTAGRVVAGVVVVDDVTREREAKEALRLSEARLQAIIDNAPAVIYLKDAEGRLLMANRAFEAFLGRPREVLLGKTDHELFPREMADVFVANDARVLATGSPMESEELAPHKDGPRTYLSLKFPLKDARGKVYALCGISSDITERKAAEEHRQRVYEFQDRLIGIASHDIRSPTAAILTTSEMLLSRPGLDASVRRPVERIARSARRVESLIGALLDYTRARLGGGIPLTPQPGDLREIVARGVEEARAGHPTREVVASLPQSMPGTWDAQRLAQVVSNLLDNALKYSAPGEPVRVSLHDEGGTSVFEVHNKGPAIPADLLPALFEPFRRGAQHDETVKHSLGLGLYIVREVVRSHGGSVEVDSDSTRGTTFRVRLRVKMPRGEG